MSLQHGADGVDGGIEPLRAYFPRIAKAYLIGEAAPAFSATLGEAGAPRWNFHKYLIGPDGQLAGTWPSQVRPTDPQITGEIDKALPKK